MAIKRALVVDDSKSARRALQKLLETHHLDVATVESGEAALDFLKKDLVDVIFMDHTMPGMDGLQAVTAIKANPRTAMIPVMMYTTKEGEVYVGQARALGAVGVLPKNVQPHQLFEMLQKLGLVQDRRVEERRVAPLESPGDGEIEAEMALDRQAVGMSVQTLVTRILEDQHLSLRSDILRSQTSFAKAVASEVLRDHAKQLETSKSNDERHDERGSSTAGRPRKIRAVVASTFMVVAAFLAWQFKGQRDDLAAQVDLLERQRIEAQLNAAQGNDAAVQLHAVEQARLRAAAVNALVWAVNQDNDHSLGEDAFNERLTGKVQLFVDQLRDIGFAGEIRMTSHLGEFCLQPDESGEPRLADPEIAAVACDELGHPLASSSYVSDRLSVAFAQLLRAEERGNIAFDLVALSLADSSAAVAYPEPTVSAKVWNDVAVRNNRVEIDVLSGTPTLAAVSVRR